MHLAAPPVTPGKKDLVWEAVVRQNASERRGTHMTKSRGLVSGKFKDLGKTKGPTLRALATRAPYFHNGSAKDLRTVVCFYDTRFHIGFTAREKDDLVAFLSAL